VLTGCIAVVILALLVDQVLGLIESGAVRRDGRRIAIGLAALLFGTATAGASLLRGPPPTTCSARRISPSNTFSRD
jgi:osmoprotectant transport system permease protein